MNESEYLFPNGKELTISGETLQIDRMKIHQVVKAAKCLRGVFDGVYKIFKAEELDKMQIVDLLVADGENILQFLAIAAKKDPTFINELDIDETLELLISVVEVNADFFVSRVMPTLMNEAEALKQYKKKT